MNLFKKDKKEARIVLTEEDFSTLVSGGEVEKDGVKIILQDIGFDRMITHVDNAMDM